MQNTIRFLVNPDLECPATYKMCGEHMEWVIIAIVDIVDPTRIYTKNYIKQMVESCERLICYSVTIKTNVPGQWGYIQIDS